MTGTSPTRRELVTMATTRFGAGLIVLPVILFLPAGTLAYWEAWLYVATFFIPVTFILIYLLRHNPALLERRLKSRERDTEQGVVIKLGTVCYLITYLLPGLDNRLGWSDVPVAAVIAADGVFLLSYGLFFLVLRENSYASRVVQVEETQEVISTGPYAVVRHPMYVAVLGMILSTPIALGSWWALIPALLMVPLLVVRIRGEERLLVTELGGYEEYVRTVRYRLIPGIW
jgi:protein-S-isoprenylcysteine O-methyltransferase Ste14